MLIAQLSDPHVRPEGMLYKGVAQSNRMLANRMLANRMLANRMLANRMLEAAIARLHALDPRPDLVLLTGDLAEAGLPAEYAAARAILARPEIPLRLSGNHDDRAGFRAAFADSPTPGTGIVAHHCLVDAAPGPFPFA
ncbi:hypothetical protein STVA_34090 [Allostella vacuolata]|nr:hypothetical protein STVA_34090 [Stella vacuolata]